MPIRIASIRVNRGGPLTRDFELHPKDLNLIFGPNESGKTYLVENIIRFLFKKGVHMRPWHFSGSAVVEGLGTDPIALTATEKGLEDYFDDGGQGLPRDLSKLLVVRAGETRLTPDPDGVGRRLLSRLLSGEEILDEIQDRIPKAVRPTAVENGALIGGKRQGKIKERHRLRSELRRLDLLLEKVRQDFTTGLIPPLQQIKSNAEETLRDLLLAKRHYAFQLNEEIAALQASVSRLPTELDCATLGTEIGIHRTKVSDRAALQQRLAQLEDPDHHYFWVQKALANYKEITATSNTDQGSKLFLILATISFAAATLMGLLGQKIGVAIAAAATILFYLIHYNDRSRISTSASGDAELGKLKAEFRRRFGTELTDMAAIQSQAERLTKDFIQSEQLSDQLAQLDNTITAQSDAITDHLQLYVGTNLSPKMWRSELLALRNSRRDLDKQIGDSNSALASLSLDESEYLVQNPGTRWEPERKTLLEDQLRSIKGNIDKEKQRLDELRDRIAQETELPGATSWEGLLSGLRSKREAIASDYRETTAEILAQTQLQAAIQECRDQETELILSRLRQEEFAGPLLALTGRYGHIKLDNEGIVLRDQNHNAFPLEQISTGAQEQAWLALRIGLASLHMEGQSAFLILDDAFQHSDWKRRANMVTEVCGLVERGWQVFYFSMDNHIRRLFRSEAKQAEISYLETTLQV